MKINVKFLANNFNWPTLAKQLDKIKELYLKASGGKIEFVFSVQQTNFDNIPWWTYPPDAPPISVDPGWYDNFVSPLGKGYHMIAFCLNSADWKPPGQVGWYTDHNLGPFEIQLKAGPKETTQWGNTGLPWVTKLLAHEIRHALYALEVSASGSTKIDPTHVYYNQNDTRLKESLAEVDYVALELGLAGKEKIRIRQIGWNDPEKGLYFPFDTPERKAALIGKLTEMFMDYQLDPTEHNLGKRPWN
jgi:hypothetical protein